MTKLKLKGNSNLLKKTKSSINQKDLSLALSSATECGAGINTQKGFVSLPSFDSESGDKEGFHGFYIADGELITDTVANIKQEINSFCGGGDGGNTPQALRLTFDSIESANLLVGDASNVADWNNFFDLPNLGGPFTSVQISGNNILLFGGSNIKVKPGLMYDQGYQYLVEIDDQAGCIISVGGDAFTYCDILTTVNLPACTIVYGREDSPYNDYGGLGECYNLVNLNIPLLEVAGSSALTSLPLATIEFIHLTNAGQGCFNSCSATIINLPQLTTAENYCFSYCNSLTTINLPSLITAGVGCFDNSTSLTTINIPSCTNLGGSVGSNGVFNGINGNTITLTVPSALMTADAGNPDGDIATLQLNNTVTVVTV